VGLMGEFDWLDSDIVITTPGLESVGNFEGTGWMFGPYLTSQLSDNLFFDARALWGRSSNDAVLDYLAGTVYTGSFDTERWLVEAKLTGQHDMDNLRFAPDLKLFYMSENQENYTVFDQVGTPLAVNGVHVDMGQLSAGLNITYMGQTGDGLAFEPYIGARAMWEFDKAQSSDDEIRAALMTGFLLKSDNTAFGAQATWDGVGANGYEGLSGKLMFSHSF
jgi:Autotransporter beta-domain